MFLFGIKKQIRCENTLEFFIQFNYAYISYFKNDIWIDIWKNSEKLWELIYASPISWNVRYLWKMYRKNRKWNIGGIPLWFHKQPTCILQQYIGVLRVQKGNYLVIDNCLQQVWWPESYMKCSLPLLSVRQQRSLASNFELWSIDLALNIGLWFIKISY